MKDIAIPATVEEYQTDILDRALPDPLITENDFYRRAVGWVMDTKTPLLYEQTHPDEYTNLSINFNWLLLRDYKDTPLGPPETIHSLYALHEFTHMTHWLPTRLSEVSAEEYADQFTRSEYRASNETEILAHYRIPELRDIVFNGMTLAVDLMKQRGIPQPSSVLLGKIRPLLIEHDDFDHLVGNDPEAQAQLARIKHFSGNREWAINHYREIRHSFLDSTLPVGVGLTDTAYEPTIEAYNPAPDQAHYESNVIANVRMAYSMCEQPIPSLTTFNDAIAAAKDLEGHHALVRN